MAGKKKPKEEKQVKEQTQEQPISMDMMQAGYGVALAPDNTFKFQVFGTQPGMLQLLGLHKYAGIMLEKGLQERAQTGDRITLEILSQLNQLTNQLQQILAMLGQPKNIL